MVTADSGVAGSGVVRRGEQTRGQTADSGVAGSGVVTADSGVAGSGVMTADSRPGWCRLWCQAW